MQYKVGIIGYGKVAKDRMKSYSAIDETSVTSIATVSAKSQTKAKKKYPELAIYEDYRQMLSEQELDIVTICTPTWRRSEQVLAVAKHGVKAILCESPISTSISSANEILEACHENGTKLMVGQPRLFLPQVAQVTELIKGKAIGELQWIFGHCNARGLLATGVHLVDLMRFFVGGSPAKWVIGQVEQSKEQSSLGHHIIGHWQFENGVRGIIELGDGATESGSEEFQLCGTAGMIGINLVGDEPLQVITKNGEVDFALDRVNPHRAEIEEMMRWIEGGEVFRWTGNEGIATLEILLGLSESARTDQTIELPLEEHEGLELETLMDND